MFHTHISILMHCIRIISRCGTVHGPLWSVLPVCSQVDAADAEVVSGADEAGLQLQSSGVGLNSLLAAVSVSQSCPQTVPEQIVLRDTASLC